MRLLADFTARPGREADVARLLADYAEHVRAEPGNIAFDAYSVQNDAVRFVVHEIYRDEAAFADHLSAPQNAAFNASLTAFIVEQATRSTMLDSVPIRTTGKNQDRS
ncbi:putative quinol monooxygenase [Plantibacter sp. Mn2098]|uniref:putative quinol monooxygenase n=1 Tax=Plantibacter sp. Mn2098 TaxID=3395266 RepID=UPI003BD94D17